MSKPPSAASAEYLRLVGGRIAVYRIIKNMPLERLADVAGLTVDQAEAFEEGIFDPTITAVQAMAEALDTTVFNVLAVHF